MIFEQLALQAAVCRRVVLSPKDELVDQSGQSAERWVCIHGRHEIALIQAA